MKLQIPIIACLLAALPAAALADQHNDRSYSRPAASVARQSTRYAQPVQRYNTQTVQRYNVQPVQRYSEQPQQRYVQPRTYVQRGAVNPWYWNHGIAWASSPAYWGGGFWGLFTVNLAFNEPAPANYYYQVAPASPGAQLLANYGLTQTDCNQPNLVDITGPDGSEICAYPNDEVGPGQYNVDPSTLSLVSD